MGSFQHRKWSYNKRCNVEVRWGIFSENLTVFVLFLKVVVNIPIQTDIISPWLLLRRMIISQLELGPPVYQSGRKEDCIIQKFQNAPLYKGEFVPLDIKEYKIIELIWTINCYDGLRTFYILLKIYSAFFFFQLQEKFFQMIKSAGLCLTRYGISVSSSLEFENMRSCTHFQFVVDKSSLTIKGSELVNVVNAFIGERVEKPSEVWVASCNATRPKPLSFSLDLPGAVSNNKDESYEP